MGIVNYQLNSVILYFALNISTFFIRIYTMESDSNQGDENIVDSWKIFIHLFLGQY